LLNPVAEGAQQGYDDARRDYVPAQVRLARVYSGHPIHGLHFASRDGITAHATDKELAETAALVKHWRTAPCRWAEISPLEAHAK
jgi:hypothetical protein